ncbi:MAG: hypothetical protein P9X24_04510 [Candidatus Hatepunaea meridiana]|nr:hypothetical protein [Candidatus Hatepunaea meridiana]
MFRTALTFTFIVLVCGCSNRFEDKYLQNKTFKSFSDMPLTDWSELKKVGFNEVFIIKFGDNDTKRVISDRNNLDFTYEWKIVRVSTDSSSYRNRSYIEDSEDCSWIEVLGMKGPDTVSVSNGYGYIVNINEQSQIITINIYNVYAIQPIIANIKFIICGSKIEFVSLEFDMTEQEQNVMALRNISKSFAGSLLKPFKLNSEAKTERDTREIIERLRCVAVEKMKNMYDSLTIEIFSNKFMNIESGLDGIFLEYKSDLDNRKMTKKLAELGAELACLVEQTFILEDVKTP